MQKPVVAVDVDEVLGVLVPVLVTWHNNEYGTNININRFYSYEFHEVFGGSKADMDKKILLFFDSDIFQKGADGHGLPAIEGAREVLECFHDKIEFHVVTSRQLFLEDITRRWLLKFFDGIFHDVHFGNHNSTEGVRRSKSEICKSIGATLLIDDSLHYTFECAREGINAALFGSYAWNCHDGELPQNVSRVQSWQDVYILLNHLCEKL